jgi:hypothetical protein
MRTTAPIPPIWDPPRAGRRRFRWTMLCLGVLAVVAISIAAFPLWTSREDKVAWESMCQSNLQQIVNGLSSYQEVHGRSPPRVLRDAEGKPLQSWRQLLLPLVENTDLIRINEDWDSRHNSQWYRETGYIFTCPIHDENGRDTSGVTNYFMLVEEGANEDNLQSDEFVIVELTSTTPWIAPVDKTLQDLRAELTSSVQYQYNGHPNGVHVATGDGVYFLTNREFRRVQIDSVQKLIAYLRRVSG